MASFSSHCNLVHNLRYTKRLCKIVRASTSILQAAFCASHLTHSFMQRKL